MKQLSNLHKLAEQYETQIRETAAEKFFDAVDELRLLTDQEEGVYISEVDPSVLCCLVVGTRSGLLYQAMANYDENHKEPLANFVATVIA